MSHKMLAVFILLAASVAGGQNTALASSDGALQFVNNVGKSVIDAIDGTDSEDVKQSKLRKAFSENVDLEWMGRFALGPGWQQASEAQRQRYMEAYKRYVLAYYTSNFADYTGSKFTITDIKDEADGQSSITMQIRRPSQPQQETEAGYRLRTEEGKFKIIDIVIEGVSMVTTQRSDFTSVLQKKGIDALISDIEAKTGSNESRGTSSL